jgi:membrane protein DedA with SNARE-associated domain
MMSLALFMSASGIPVPGTLLVIAGGAFAQQGILEWRTAFLAGLFGVLLGDSTSFMMGRIAKGWVQRRFGHSSIWQSAQEAFSRRGKAAIYLTRFLVTPLAIPTNLIAGSSGYHFSRFLLYDAAGEISWLAIFGGLGYIFGSNWELINQFVTDSSGLLAGIALIVIGIYFFIWCRRRACFRAVPKMS